MHVDEEMYTPAEVAEYLKVDIRTVYRWIRGEEMDAIQFGREYRISENDLRKFLESHRRKGSSN